MMNPTIVNLAIRFLATTIFKKRRFKNNSKDQGTLKI